MPRFRTALENFRTALENSQEIKSVPVITDDERCLYQARLQRDIAMQRYNETPLDMREPLGVTQPFIYDRFESCTLKGLNRKREVLEQIKGNFEPETLEGRILRHYSDVLESVKRDSFRQNADGMQSPSESQNRERASGVSNQSSVSDISVKP